MANKIIFGADLIKVLEKEYKLNKLGEVPTKYKNGITTIDFIYGKEKDIDDLKYDKPYVEFSIDDETDGFISGTMYLNGGVEGIQFDSWEDLKYFMKNAKWTESRKSLKESNQIIANIWEWQKLLNGVFNFTKWITKTFVNGETLHKSLEKIYRDEEITLDEFVNACIDYIGDSQFEEKINEYVKQYLSTDDKIKNAFKTKGIKVVESKKSISRKSMKEGIDVKIVYADDTPSEYIDDVTHNDILDIIEESPEVYKIFDVSGSKKKLVWSDEYGFERAYESKKSARKSIKESKDLTDLCNSWVIGDAVGKFKNRDYCHKGNDYSVFNIGNIIEDALRDNYILEFDGDNKAKSVIFYMVDKDGKNVGSLEIYPDERYEISNYEDGYDLSKLDMDEIADLFYEFQNNKIEYLLSDKRFDFTDKFWYNESKKSTRKSLKEGINDELIATSSDGETTLYLSDERQANHGKDPHYEFKLGENGYFTRYIRCDDNRCENVVLDWIKEFDLDISKSEISKIIKLHESKKFTRKSMKESTDESFSLYDLNKHDPFIKEWVKNINKELKDVSIESIGDDEIVFRVWFDESIDLDIFDDIVTDCMPRTLIEFMSDMNIDFGYQFVYADDKFTENDFVFIRFVAW